MGHPLVSPALGYLGGLPPLFFIASDKEVLRDEIIFAFVNSLLSRKTRPDMSPIDVERIRLHVLTVTPSKMKPADCNHF